MLTFFLSVQFWNLNYNQTTIIAWPYIYILNYMPLCQCQDVYIIMVLEYYLWSVIVILSQLFMTALSTIVIWYLNFDWNCIESIGSFFETWLFWNSLFRQVCPCTHRDPPASTWHVLVLKACTTMHSSIDIFW